MENLTNLSNRNLACHAKWGITGTCGDLKALSLLGLIGITGFIGLLNILGLSLFRPHPKNQFTLKGFDMKTETPEQKIIRLERLVRELRHRQKSYATNGVLNDLMALCNPALHGQSALSLRAMEWLASRRDKYFDRFAKAKT